MAACGDAGAVCVNNGMHFDDALRARLDEDRVREEQAAAAKPDVDRLVNEMGTSIYRNR